MAGSERPPRPFPTCPAFMGSCTLAGAPHRLPRRRSTSPSPWMTPPGGRAGQPPQGGAGAPYLAPPFAPPGTVCVARPGDAAPSPDTPPCPPHGDDAYSLGPGRLTPTLRGGPCRR